jgi:tRNA A-37 threonylcarbamoyl transferase component Bud32
MKPVAGSGKLLRMSSSSAHPTVAHQPVEVPASGTTVAAPASPSSPPAVELVRSTVREDPMLVRFMRGRARLFSLINLCAWAILLTRDLTTANDTYVGSRIVIFATALVLQAVITILTRSPWANSARRCSALGLVCASLLIIVIASVEFETLRRSELTSHVFAADVRSVIGVHYANSWALLWFAVIFIDAALYPRTVRWTLGVGGCVAIIAICVCLAAYAANGALTAADLRVLVVQTAFWVVLATALGVVCQYRLESLQQQADKAKRFGQYKLTRKLEAGGMGEVHLAEHLLLKRPSVIKMVRADRATDPALLARFEREVRILATLTHPNTVAVFDYGYTADGTFYYVMEYLPGLDLDRLVTERGPLPPGRVIHLLRQVCAALREAHATGLIHRDIKPKNVMACERGGVPDVAKLLDFGLVQVDMGSDSRLTGGGAVMGTPAYMSPEQASGLPTDARSDVYSLGATAYFLLTGRPPFERPTLMLTLTAHITDQPPPLAETIPADLAAIVLRCLAKKPESRFADVCELAAALTACPCAAEWSEPHAATWWTAHRPARG